MIPTLIGVVTAAIGMLFLVGFGTPVMLSFLTIVSLLGGAAAVILPALGGSSIPPMQFAILFLMLRILVPGGGQIVALGAALRANLALVLFVIFGVVMAYVGPRMFAHQMTVVPMRFTRLNSLLATAPLVPSSQNITTAFYLIGSLLAALGGYVAARDPRTPALFVRTGVAVAWLHVGSGVFGAIVRHRPLSDLIDFFRNGAYAQTDQYVSGYARISGVMPEPSSYALFAFSWFVFMLEAWLRDVMPRRTGPAALALATILVVSTSSTAYAGLAAYGLVLGVRVLLFPQALTGGKAIMLGALAVAMVFACSAAIAVAPRIVTDFTSMVADMTVAKRGSDSGIQRAFWAYKGIEAFRVSGGLGIGPGSFRSSSLITAIIGSTGLIGSVTFTVYLVQVLKPLRRSTYLRPAQFDEGVAVAASWAAFMTMAPAAVLLPAPDPGATFAIFAGVAMALRVQGLATRTVHPVPRSAAVRQHAP